MRQAESGKAIIISAPSGAGKTTILERILPMFGHLTFSVSATNREPRENEINGKAYYFLSDEEFKKGIEDNEFVEWEEVYNGTYYGTLRSEITRIWGNGQVAIFDVDVMGALKLKESIGENTLSLFIKPPSLEVLEMRLQNRFTETEESIAKRVKRAKMELSYATKFDKVILNDDLEVAVKKVVNVITEFIRK